MLSPTGEYLAFPQVDSLDGLHLPRGEWRKIDTGDATDRVRHLDRRPDALLPRGPFGGAGPTFDVVTGRPSRHRSARPRPATTSTSSATSRASSDRPAHGRSAYSRAGDRALTSRCPTTASDLSSWSPAASGPRSSRSPAARVATSAGCSAARSSAGRMPTSRCTSRGPPRRDHRVDGRHPHLRDGLHDHRLHARRAVATSRATPTSGGRPLGFLCDISQVGGPGC